MFKIQLHGRCTESVAFPWHLTLLSISASIPHSHMRHYAPTSGWRFLLIRISQQCYFPAISVVEFCWCKISTQLLHYSHVQIPLNISDALMKSHINVKSYIYIYITFCWSKQSYFIYWQCSVYDMSVTVEETGITDTWDALIFIFPIISIMFSSCLPFCFPWS